MIISFFGPDGVGKSTAAEALRDMGWSVLSGTGVASWPDQTWHKSLVARGIDETRLDSQAHFYEKIDRAHQLARDLEAAHGDVVIDSDPLHKTIVYGYQKHPRKLPGMWSQLSQLAGHQEKQLVHVYFQVDESGDSLRQAKVLQQRLQSRGNLAYFDPRTVQESQGYIEACLALRSLLESKGEKVVVVNTDSTFDAKDFLYQVKG